MTHVSMKYIIFPARSLETVVHVDRWRMLPKAEVTLSNRHGHAARAGTGIIRGYNDTGRGTAKAWKWCVTLRGPLSLSLPRFFLSARILGPDSQREIQFLLTAPCCPDRIYHLELELLPERQCTVDTSWTAPVTTLTNAHTHTCTHARKHTHTHACAHTHRNIIKRHLAHLQIWTSVFILYWLQRWMKRSAPDQIRDRILHWDLITEWYSN